MPARLLKSSSVNEGRCGTPSSTGSQPGCGSPGPANVASGSPSSISSSNAISTGSNIGPSPNTNNHTGPPGQRGYYQRSGRFGGNYGHHSNYNHLGVPFNQKPGSPPYSRILLDFMMRQWQVFETSYFRRTSQQQPPAGDYNCFVSPTSPRQMHPPHRSTASPHRHSQRGGGGGGAAWQGANSRRFSDNSHHHSHLKQSQSIEDYPPTSASQQLPSHGEQQHHNTGSLRRNRPPGQFSQNDHPWQRRPIIDKKNSPGNTMNRYISGHPRLPVNAPVVSSLDAQKPTEHSNGPTGDQPPILAHKISGDCSGPPITNEMQALSVANQPISSIDLKKDKSDHSIKVKATSDDEKNEACKSEEKTECEGGKVAPTFVGDREKTFTSISYPSSDSTTLMEATPPVSTTKPIPIMQTEDPSTTIDVASSHPVGKRLVSSGRSTSGASAGGGESISISVCSSSFGSLIDQGDALSTVGEQYFTPDPPSSPSNAIAAISMVSHHSTPPTGFSSSSPPTQFFQSDSQSPSIATPIAPPLIPPINR